MFGDNVGEVVGSDVVDGWVGSTCLCGCPRCLRFNVPVGGREGKHGGEVGYALSTRGGEIGYALSTRGVYLGAGTAGARQRVPFRGSLSVEFCALCLPAARSWCCVDEFTYAHPVSRHTKPPVSLHGQLLWRDFYYVNGLGHVRLPIF